MLSGLAGDFLEDAIKMRERLKIGVIGHFANVTIPIEQERLGLFDLHAAR